MRADGIVGGWHKCSDGLRYYVDPFWPTAVSRMRGNFDLYGAYHVLWGNRSITDQVDWWFSILDQTAPGWRTDPRFALVTDNEPFSYQQAPTVDQINVAGDYIRARVGKTMIGYSAPWYYGADLSRQRYPLITSDYGTNPAVHYLLAYPGDRSGRWSGRSPVSTALQYGSMTVMGNQSTCDANAFQGGAAGLRRLLNQDHGGDTRMIVMAHEKGSNVDWIGDGVFRYQCPDAAHRANALVVMGLQGNSNPSSVEFNPGTLDALGPIVVSAPAGVPATVPPTAVTLTDADRQAIADLVSAEVGAKQDQALAAIAALNAKIIRAGNDLAL